MKNLLSRLLIQRRRFLRATTKLKNDCKRKNPYVHHDLDYYLVISRRLYRFVQELAEKNSRIANIKGKKEYKGLYEKLKMRDHTEHPPEDWSEFPSITPNSQIKAIHNVIVNNNGIFIRSGSEICKSEVVGFKEGKVLSIALGEIQNISPSCQIVSTGKSFSVGVGDKLLGRVIDAKRLLV